jgi:hypothetical protein
MLNLSKKVLLKPEQEKSAISVCVGVVTSTHTDNAHTDETLFYYINNH